MKNDRINEFVIYRIRDLKAIQTNLIKSVKTILRFIKRRDIFYFPFLIILSHQSSAACSLPKPSNVKISSWTSCDATLKWDAVPGAAYYKVRYKYENAIGWTISAQISATSYTFTNLTADSNYKFAV